MSNITRQGLLVLLSGPSGVGKGTVLGQFLAKRDDCVVSVSATTRAPREGEVDGQSYFFISRETFQQWIDEDRFLEWDEHFGNCYGTPREFVEKQRTAGKHVILEIDVVGADLVMHKVPDAVGIFIAPPSLGTLRQRLITRGTESEEQLQGRFARIEKEMSYIEKYGYVVINDKLDDAVADMEAIFRAEMNRSSRLSRDGVIEAIKAGE